MAKKKTNTQTVYAAFQEVDKRLQQIVLAGIYEMRHTAGQIADEGRDHVKQIINHPGTYRPYTYKGRIRYSSRPGEPPAAIVGERLEPTITSGIISKNNQNPAVAYFGAGAEFARDLEFGTPEIAPRPFIRPTREYLLTRLKGIIVGNLRHAYERKIRRMNPIEIQVN